MGTAGQGVGLSSQKEFTMRAISSIVALGALAVAGCSAQPAYYPRTQATYAPATTTYYNTPAGTTYYNTPAQTYYAPDAPSFQKSNVYSSQSDYYRNYQGIHDGPERTGW
jgi:hypothetical protein